MSEKTERIVTDISTLKKVLQPSQTWQRILIGVLLANSGVIGTIGYGLLSDHYSLMHIVPIVETHTVKIDELKTKTESNAFDIRFLNGKIDNFDKKENKNGKTN